MAAPLPPKNVDRMLWSTEFKALSALSVGIGVVFGSFSALTPVILIDEFGFDQQGVAILMAVCAFLNTVAMRVGFTKVVAYFKHPALVAGNASVLQAVIMAVTPFALYNLYTYIAITVASTLAICYQLPSTTLMATLYADKYAQNARGTAVGTTRSFFSVGQAIGPYLSLVLYNVYQGLPFFVIAAIAFSTSLFAGYAHRVSKDIKFDDQEESLLQNEKEQSVNSTTAKGLPITRVVEAEDDLEGGK
jgi:MFS family permease